MKKLLVFVSIFVFTFLFVSCDFLNTTTTTTTQISTESTTGNTTQTTTQQGAISTTTDEQAVITTTERTSGQTTGLETTEQITTQEQTTTQQTTTETTTTSVVYDRYQEINLYSINDFHGGTYSDISNLEEIGSFLKSEKADSENTIILSNGDIFQGAALSNYYHGEPIVDVFNNIGFDGFIIGNHEFDWGIDQVLNYSDGDLSNGEMEYPILAANIVYEDTQEMLENTVPYIIKEVSGVKVGIIGLIGSVINSISASRVENIEFLNPEDTIYQYASELRVDEDCDIVVVYIHNGSGVNDTVANFTGDHYVDAIFNGHTHQSETRYITRDAGGVPLYYAQASNYSGSLFVGISLTYDNLLEKVTAGESANYDFDDVDNYSDSEIFSIINSYQNDSVYTAFVSEILTVSSDYYSRYDLVGWGATVLRDYVGIDAGALNSGGFRNSIESGDLTMGDMIEIYPFDNYIKTCEMTGSEFTSLYNSLLGEDVHWDEGVYKSGSTVYIKGLPVVASQIYVVGAVDYVFDKDYYDFLDGDNITLTNYLMRDLIVEDLKNTVGNFDPSNGTSYQELFTIYDPNFYREIKLSITL